MRSLILGGSGFVGRNLAKSLVQDGDEVACLDRVPDQTGNWDGVFFQCDAQDPLALRGIIDNFQPERVYHLAANSDIQAGIQDASLDFGDTLMTTVALREAVNKSTVKEVMFASSSAIFGISDKPFAETSDSIPAPVSWYGKAKLASEFILESLAAQDPSLKILLVRFPNVVGPLATHGVIFDFINKLRNNQETLQVLGDGFQEKPYLHVHDLIDGIKHFTETLQTGIKRINIGPADTTTVRFIAEQVAKGLDLQPDIQYQDSAFGWAGDVPKYSFDTTSMRLQGFSIRDTSNEAVVRAISDLVKEYETK